MKLLDAVLEILIMTLCVAIFCVLAALVLVIALPFSPVIAWLLIRERLKTHTERHAE